MPSSTAPFQAIEPVAGKFTLDVPADLPNYVTVYCMPGYYPREELLNQNNPDGVAVAGEQLELMPLKADARAVGRALEAHIRRLASTVEYIRNARPGLYDTAVSQLDPEIRQLVVQAAAVRSRALK